jgi:hypothetical protein
MTRIERLGRRCRRWPRHKSRANESKSLSSAARASASSPGGVPELFFHIIKTPRPNHSGAPFWPDYNLWRRFGVAYRLWRKKQTRSRSRLKVAKFE